MSTSAELYSLQEIDLAIDSRRVRLVAIEQELGETEELVETRQRWAEKQERLGRLKEQLRDLEWRVDEVRAKAAQVEKKLYGGSIRNPKELQDLQADLRVLQAEVRRREDELLAVMVQAEEEEAAARAAKMTLAAMEARWQEIQASLLAEKSRLEGELAELEDKRRRQASGYGPSQLALYDLLRERKDGRAVAKVEQGMCGGCRITLPMSLLQKVRGAPELVQCPRCERILYIS